MSTLLAHDEDGHGAKLTPERFKEALEARGFTVERTSRGYRAQCPCHDDSNPSLDIDPGRDGRALVKCRACGADFVQVGKALELLGKSSAGTARGRSPKPTRARRAASPEKEKPTRTFATLDEARRAAKPRGTGWKLAKEYRYLREDGSEAQRVLRFECFDKEGRRVEKSFRPVSPRGERWAMNAAPAPRPLYRLPELAAQRERIVFLVEGEKAADALAELFLEARAELCAATWNGGTGGVGGADFGPLAGRRVVLWPDHDEAGRKAMDAVEERLASLGGGATVQRLEVPGLPEKGDAADWIAAEREAGKSALELWRELEGLIRPQAWSEVRASSASDSRPELRCDPQHLGAAVEAAASSLRRSTLEAATPIERRLFVRGGELVQIRRDEALDARRHALGLPQGAPRVVPVRKTVQIRDLLDGCTRWVSGEPAKPKPIHPPELVAAAILEGRRDFPRLEAVFTAPTLRRNGSILDAEGYDAETGYFLDFGAVRFDPIPDRPSRRECERARDLLLEPFQGFPFASEADCSALLAVLLTAIARPALEIAPFFGIDSPSAGTGKTLLARCAGILATGFEPALVPPNVREEEFEKVLTAALLAGARVILLDNLEGPLRSPALCAMLTGPRAGLRPLGRSESVDVPTCALFLGTGNGFTPLGDLSSRCSIIRLDAGTADPTARTFETEATKEVSRRRPELVRHALTILRGRMQASEAPSRRATRFPDWDRRIRDAVLWLGMADPAATLFRAREEDPERTNIEALFRAWSKSIGERARTAAELAREPALREALALLVEHPLDEPRGRQALGYWLKGKHGYRAAGFVLERLPRKEAPIYRLRAEGGDLGDLGDFSTPHEESSKEEERRESAHRAGQQGAVEVPQVPEVPPSAGKSDLLRELGRAELGDGAEDLGA